MNSKGIFCFLLLLAFFALEIDFLSKASGAEERIAGAKVFAFEAEKASFARTLMENSVDAVIEESLKEGLLLNKEPDEIKKHVNSRLTLLFMEMEKAYGGEVPVRFDSKSLDEEFLNENSTVLVKRLGKKTVEAEYAFTGGLMKSNAVLAEIAGSKSRLLFKIPPGYSVKAKAVE